MLQPPSPSRGSNRLLAEGRLYKAGREAKVIIRISRPGRGGNPDSSTIPSTLPEEVGLTLFNPGVPPEGEGEGREKNCSTIVAGTPYESRVVNPTRSDAEGRGLTTEITMGKTRGETSYLSPCGPRTGKGSAP